MTKEKAQQQGELWMQRVFSANKYFNEWESKFKCNKLSEYYEGNQWVNDPEKRAFVLNLFYSTIEIKEPSLVFKEPQFFLTPRPSRADYEPEIAFAQATAASDILNTLVSSRQMSFADNIEMSLFDSFFYFGMVEVGYGANWVKNPNAGKPVIASDYDPNADPDKILVEPAELPESEWIYAKRIPAHRFRIGTNDCFQLEKANWVGYYEYVRLSDFRSPKSGFKHTADVEVGDYKSSEFIPEDQKEEERVGDLIKVWKIWDLRALKFRIVAETTKTVHFEEHFERLPIFGLKFSKRRKGWLPVPVSFNWKTPQDEQNEALDQMRTHRRRSKRAFQVVKNSVDPDELEKFRAGEDGVIVETNKDNAINPVGNSPVDSSIAISLQTSLTNFNLIAGTSATERGQSARTTATESSIIDNRAQVRESKEREICASWMCSIGREILLQAIEKFTMPTWVKMLADTDGWGAEYAQNTVVWKQINAGELAGVEFDVQIQMSSMSPVANEQELNNFLKFLAIINQYPMLSLNPTLIREAAYKLGYRNEKVIQAMQQAAQLQMIGQISQGQQNMGGSGDMSQGGSLGGEPGIGGSIAQKTVAQMQPPDQAEVDTQLAAQGVPVG